MKAVIKSFAAAAIAAAPLVNTPETAEAHHGGFWVTGNVCNDGFNLYNCRLESVFTTVHGAQNCARDGYLPVFVRYPGSNYKRYNGCDFNW